VPDKKKNVNEAGATPETDQPESESTPEAKQAATAFPVVGIGASAGGLEALETFFTHMPADSGLAFVVVTHQHPGHTSLLPELLARDTRMAVAEARDGVRVEPNHVYVGPPGGQLAMADGRLHLVSTGDGTPRLPIDSFLRSLALDCKDHAVCIILSGTGGDGTLGLKAVKGESGMAMVQEPKTATHAGMPTSAIATGLADYVLPPAGMPEQLLAYVRGPFLNQVPPPADQKEAAVPVEPIQRVFQLLRGRTGHDFSGYKLSTMRRRIERRMNMHLVKDPEQYVRYLRDNPHELDLLFKELLIGVTSFFRDPESFQALADRALPGLFQSRPENSTLRVWSAGCSTGEEAYSLAIQLLEQMKKLNRYFTLQIYGTDLDNEAIEAARVGVYPHGIAVDVAPERLERYFHHEDSTYRIRKEVREQVVFAQQNIIKDPPFTKLDLLCCRNLLIYLNLELQKRLFPLFHYSLRPGGILFLGPSETVGGFTDLFEVLDKKWKIFRRRDVSSVHPMVEFYSMPMPEPAGGREPVSLPFPTREGRVSGFVERMLLARFAPTSVVTNDRGDIIYFHGRTGVFLEPPVGPPRLNVVEMAREGLRLELITTLRQASVQDQPIERKNVLVRTNGDVISVDVTIEKILEPESIRGLLLITFRTSAPPAPAVPPVATTPDTEKSGRIVDLEHELKYTRETLQTAIEEVETSNEELKSANEELQSMNEELQSTNEELETTKEETQSLNEELTTVNTELQAKVEELSRTNDDMKNLLNSTDIATIFLDRGLNIKRYTEQARRLINLIPSDVGRPIAHLASNLQHDQLAEECAEVLRSLMFKETEVRTKGAAIYLMRVMPYRTSENVIDGLVITFVDITRLREAEQASREARSTFEGIVQTVREPLIVLDASLRVVSVNRSFCKAFQTTARQVEGELLFDLGNRQWDIPDLRHLLEEILPKNTAFEDFEVDHEFPKIGRRRMALNARRLHREGGLPDLILLALEDVTAKRPQPPDGDSDGKATLG
jgi:two-component system CheB/CheR fusion protein